MIKQLIIISFLCMMLMQCTPQHKETIQFPIIAWYGNLSKPANWNDFNRLDYAYFNKIVLETGSLEENFRYLEMADSMGIQLYLQDNRLLQFLDKDEQTDARIDTIMMDYFDKKALAGFYVMNRPGLDDLTQLSALQRKIRRSLDVPIFLNLQPIYANPTLPDTLDYLDYVSQYADNLKPNHLSCALFPVFEDSVSKSFYRNLSVLRQVSLENNIPFWGSVLVTPFYPHPNIKHSHIRMPLYAALAYGAQGAFYFSYRVPANDSDRSYRNAMISRNNETTKVYQMVRRINAELLRLSTVLLKSTSTGVYNHATRNGHGLPASQSWIDKISNPSVLAGFFRDTQGHRYILLVNTDIEHGCEVNVYFDNTIRHIKEIPKDDSIPLEESWGTKETKKLKIVFKSGDGRLLQVMD